MSEFGLYFGLGREHILDINGYDHILFVMTLCAAYQFTEIKRVMILITAFTVGHSVTLALVTLDVLSINRSLVEFLIPVTIFLTAMSNILKGPSRILSEKMIFNYILAIAFGLIHGMGFSSYLSSLLGSDSGIISELFAFNLGLEFGQLLIVFVFLIVGFTVTSILGSSRKDWNLVVSAASAAVAVTLMIETKFW